MDNYRRNYYAFGLGTIGRDMIYSMISMFLLTTFLKNVVDISEGTYAIIVTIIVLARVFDAVNDPIMGVIVDNTKSKWGKFKPWILIGAFISGIMTLLIFTDFGLRGVPFILLFTLLYLLWGISFTANDISYWSMLPSLTLSQKKRENMGAFARICANIGLFTVVVGIIPITDALTNSLGSATQAYFVFTAIVVLILWVGQAITLIGVKEPVDKIKTQPATKLSELFGVIVKNDQLLWVAISMVLFMIGYVTTTTFGIPYFQHIFGDLGMYAVFAGVLGVSQLLALGLFPLFSKKYTRQQLFTFGMILVVVGYLVFFFSPNNIIFVGIAGISLFFGQAFIQMLMLMFLADTIDYGHWKLGKRNEAVTFSLQPFINKMGGAIASGIVGYTLVLVNVIEIPEDTIFLLEGSDAMLFKVIMLVLPLILILISYVLYRKFYKIDKKMFDQIIHDLVERGEIKQEEDENEETELELE